MTIATHPAARESVRGVVPCEATIRFSSYCGMSWPPRTLPFNQARKRVADLIRLRRKQGFPVTTLEPGREWEVMEPEDAVMVDDRCGQLTLDPVPPAAYEDEDDE